MIINEEVMKRKVEELNFLLNTFEACDGSEWVSFYVDEMGRVNCGVSSMKLIVLDLVLTYIDISINPFAEIVFRGLNIGDPAIDYLKRFGYREIYDDNSEPGLVSLSKERSNVVYVDFRARRVM